MISIPRRQWISELAESIASNFFSSQEPIEPKIISRAYNLSYCYGEYGDYFDGMLEHYQGEFHVYINTSRHNNLARHKFSFAHELGHYFIDEHAIALAQGFSAGHCSQVGFLSDRVVEREADFFAASLLMPQSRIKRLYSRNRKFSFKIIEGFAKTFQVSLLSSLYRVFYLDLHPMMIVKIKDGKILGYPSSSKDFYYKLRSKALPNDSGAYKYFRENSEVKSQELYAFDWFNTESDKTLYEYNIIIHSLNLIYTILWTD